MLDVIIGRHTWNCQMRTHMHTEIHTHTHTQKPKNNKKDVTTISKPQSLTSVRTKDCTLRVPNKTSTLYFFMSNNESNLHFIQSSALVQASSSLSMGRTRAWPRGSLHQKLHFRHFFVRVYHLS